MSSAPDARSEHGDDMSAYGFLIGLALGTPLMGYGVWWLLHNARLTNPDGWLATLAAAVFIHDAIVVPLVALVGFIVIRWVPEWAKAPVQVAAVLSAVVAIYAIPALTDFGRRPSNPTLLPHNMAVNLTVVIVVIWLVAGLWALLRRRQDLRH
ncbi:MAG: hypothetical protein R3320_03055 [Nitriliruptorales bacterium]|nr:hypothetical protein [Nitriliruptorales bacterium]